MKLTKFLVRSLFSTEKRSCIGQLRDDFGDFPPVPLRCKDFPGEFEVVRTRGIGEIWHILSGYKRILRGIESDEQYLSEDFKEYFDIEQLFTLRRAFDSFGPSSRFIKPLVISLGLGIIGLKMGLKMLKSVRQES